MSIEIQPATSNIGAYVSGIDLARPLDAESVSTIESALVEHLVLFFRDQTLTQDEQISFTRNFGKIQRPPVKTKHQGNPDLNCYVD